jgi:hypothetical protein
MNTAVAVTDQICRTVLYLAAICGGVKLAPLVLPRVQVAAQRQPKPGDQHQIIVTATDPVSAAAVAAARKDAA